MTLVKAQRLLRGYSQAELGRSVGVGKWSISHVETRKRPAWPALRRRLATALGIPEADLFDERGFGKGL